MPTVHYHQYAPIPPKRNFGPARIGKTNYKSYLDNLHGNLKYIECFGCGRKGHFRRDRVSIKFIRDAMRDRFRNGTSVVHIVDQCLSSVDYE